MKLYTRKEVAAMVARVREATKMDEEQIKAFEDSLRQIEAEPKNEDIKNWLASHDKQPPSCTNRAQYKLWREIVPHVGRSGFCTDCTPEFQHQSLVNDCCDHPECVFFLDEDGEIEGSLYGEYSKREIITYKKWKEMQ